MDASPHQLEADVRENLRKHFEQATTTAELIIAGQQLDAAVEQLANWRLGLSSEDPDGPSFGAKIKQTWPNHYSELHGLHRRRNDFAHGTHYQDDAAISWANQYVGCVIRIWSNLFGSVPPRVTPPRIVPHPAPNTANPRADYGSTTVPAHSPLARQPAIPSRPAASAKKEKAASRPVPWPSCRERWLCG